VIRGPPPGAGDGGRNRRRAGSARPARPGTSGRPPSAARRRWVLTPGTSVGTSTTPMPWRAQASIARRLTSARALPRRARCTASSVAVVLEEDAGKAGVLEGRHKPVILCQPDAVGVELDEAEAASRPAATISGRSSRTVGSPPESWMLLPAAMPGRRRTTPGSPPGWGRIRRPGWNRQSTPGSTGCSGG
jgi:hypothetical protein